MSVYIDIEKKLGAFDLKIKLEAGDETLTLVIISRGVAKEKERNGKWFVWVMVSLHN